jgi:HD superfamily phosphodiesterase
MNVTVIFESAELQFKQILEDFFVKVYDEKSLSSHGIDHHRRVWNYAREISLFLFRNNILSDPLIPSNLIIACYLHDIGMSIDKGIRHGQHSRDLCTIFLKENNLKESDYDDVLLAIENHDNKEYYASEEKYDLLTILSAADDLDAFGFTGIYRYAEIYLARDIDRNEIGDLIKGNASKRFENFERSFKVIDTLVDKQRLRYQLLDTFFSEYTIQLRDYKFGHQKPSGYCGVVEFLQKVLQNKIELADLCKEPEMFSDDKVILWFFNGLSSELLVEHN